MAKTKAKMKAKPVMKASKAKSSGKVIKLKVGGKGAKARANVKPKVDMTDIKPISEKQTKSQIIKFISEQTGVSKSEVGEIFKALAVCVHGQMKKRGFGEISIPETGIKIRRIRKPATKARTMVSPFTGQEITVKAKPARNVVKITALKSLKESVVE